MPTIIPLTREPAWLEALGAVPMWEPPAVPTLVLAPHPDDETLGAGGLISLLREHDVPVSVVAITDGENAYPELADLDRIRVPEQTAALACLGINASQIHRLRLPDSDVSLHEKELVAQLRALAQPGMHLVAPWSRDYHPDHESVGRAAARVADLLGLSVSFYLFWTWHRGTPADFDGLLLAKLALAARHSKRREQALQAHASQLQHHDGQPILSEELLTPARRPFEIYIQHA